MTTPTIDLTSRPDSPNVHQPLQATATKTTATTHPPPPQPQQSTTDSMLIKRFSEFEQIMVNLIQDNKHLEERDLPEADMKEILHQRMWETNSYKTHEDHMMLYEALEKSMNHTMADVNVNAPAEQAPAMAPPTHTDDQILPHNRCVPSLHCFLIIPSIYIQQFWDIIRYDRDTARYTCQLDEQWFNLTKDTLRDALQITPVNNNNPFSSPPTPDALINFVNNLGYPKVIKTLSAVVTNDMFQLWRALTTIINLCLTGKTSGFKRPRALVLQILWGIVNRAHIDYAERMWEELTQSIHSFVEDKKNLALHTQEKKKANPIVILSIKFTKLIIHHLQSKHKFHPRIDSPFHFPYEEYILGYLKFSAKGTKREVFRMPIPNELITADNQGEQYYKEYLKKVAKHQRYLIGEERSDPDSPTPKPAKAAKKSKPSAPKAAPVTKPAVAQQPKPKPAPTKPQEKKRKLVTETSDKPYLAKSSKPGLVTKRRKPTRSLSLVDEFVDEEADMQTAVEESLKSVHDAHRGPLPLVVIREPDSGKFQPLLEVQGKGKEKRRTPAPTKPSGYAESPSIYPELGLTESAIGSDEEGSPMARSNLGNDAEPQPQSSHVVHTGPNLEHIDLEATDVSTQPHPEQMDEGFTATAYPNVHENLKLPIKEHVILEEPASSTATLSSLQHLAKDFSFRDLFFNDKPSEAEN
nr:monodehydroascorbate reductase [Tanacetum cinerariifolium]